MFYKTDRNKYNYRLRYEIVIGMYNFVYYLKM